MREGRTGNRIISTRNEVLAKPQVGPASEGLGISAPPKSLEEQASYDRRMESWLLELLRQECSESEWQSWWTTQNPRETVELVSGKLDEIIIRNAGTYTWRMFYCTLVRDRYQRWCVLEKGLALVKRFHSAIIERLRIDRGQAKGTVTEQWIEAKSNAIPELRRLLKQFHVEVQQRRDRFPTFREARERLLRIIEQSFEPRSFLGTNRKWMADYLEHVATNDPTRAIRICNGRARPEDIFLGMGAWNLGLTEDTFRNNFSKVASSKKSFKPKA